MLRLLHSLPYKFLPQRSLIPGNDGGESSGGKGGESPLPLGRQARGKGAAMQFPPRFRPVRGGRRLMRLNLGNLPSPPLDKFGVWYAEAMGTDDDFSG